MDTLELNTKVDDILWTPSTDNSYSVKTCYVLINDGGIRSQYRKHFWKCYAPLKIKILAWQVTHDKILSRENLVKKGWIGPSNCGFCDCALESTKHIFLHCPVAVAVWGFFLHTTFGINETHIGEIFSLFQYVNFNLNLLGWNMLVLAVLLFGAYG